MNRRYPTCVDKTTADGVHIAISREDFRKFNSSLLGLGDMSLNKSGEDRFDVIAAIFDIESFTSCFDRRDSHTSIPRFIDSFLAWLFHEIKDEFLKKELDGDALLWGYLPMFAKFLGDGVMFIWEIPNDDRHGGGPAIGNIIVRLHRITKLYKMKFLPTINQSLSDAPQVLRCGGAYGQVVSIGNDSQDYVGACINLASRLQKAEGLSFAFAKQGCDPENCFSDEFRNLFITKSYKVRGFGKKELILVDKEEFQALPKYARKFYDGEN